MLPEELSDLFEPSGPAKAPEGPRIHDPLIGSEAQGDPLGQSQVPREIPRGEPAKKQKLPSRKKSRFTRYPAPQDPARSAFKKVVSVCQVIL